MKKLALFLLVATSAHAGWQSTQWNKNVSVTNIAPNGFMFLFPVNGHANAIQTSRGVIALNKTIVLRFSIAPTQGAPVYRSLDKSKGLPPNFRPMLQVNGDDYVSEDNRWWPAGANCAFLAPSTTAKIYELRIAISPNMWSNVWGKLASTRLKAFKKVLNHNGKLNIVFGGGNSFSHGVNATNKPKFTLISWRIE